MSPIITPKPPPTEFLLWARGEVVESAKYPPLKMTDERLQSAFDNYTKQRRPIAMDYEHGHGETGGDNLAVTDLALTPEGLQLTAIRYIEETYGKVSTGKILWLSPEFTVDGDEIDIMKISFTNNPATWGAKPLIELAKKKEVIMAKPKKFSDSIEDEDKKMAEPKEGEGDPKGEKELSEAKDDQENTEESESDRVKQLSEAILAAIQETDPSKKDAYLATCAGVAQSMADAQKKEAAELAGAGAISAGSSGGVQGAALEDNKKLAMLNKLFSGKSADEIEGLVLAREVDSEELISLKKGTDVAKEKESADTLQVLSKLAEKLGASPKLAMSMSASGAGTLRAFIDAREAGVKKTESGEVESRPVITGGTSSPLASRQTLNRAISQANQAFEKQMLSKSAAAANRFPVQPKN